MCGPAEQVEPNFDQAAQLQINQDLWNHYLTNYKPLINAYVTQSTSPDSVRLQEKRATGQVNADVMSKAKPVSVNPVTNQIGMTHAADVATSAKTNAKTMSKARQVGSELNIVNIGRGQATKTLAGMEQLAEMSSEAAIKNKEREMMNQAVLENAIGSGIGAAAGAATSIGKSGKNMAESWAPGGKALTYGSDEFNKLALKWG